MTMENERENDNGGQEEKSALVQEALRMGAELEPDDIPEEFKETKSIKDALGDGKIVFHDDLVKRKFNDLVGEVFIIRQIRIVPDWDSVFGSSEFALMLIEFPGGGQQTTLGGGRAIMRQCKRLIASKSLPVKVLLRMLPGTQGEYYIFE